ncbi:MAG TPA: LamG domain-containing protein [Rhodopirellula baltica]|uniref:Similar to polydom protein (Pentaxin domain) n=1 Tax=Rhodopirellula baltica (strain DSM 10527 / NCIMB 13988 / SH1) TaxID=243090 RepID=Q7UQ49_RHOBA|nr:LamG domain-containing protein [Rhodopirellula baltica]CAD74856.1 similar to polydom protein (pentaxin domain) [Rhodopirellula baltica SH 1]HBE62601.1 LamG domain-containing protein [Rhodopirellula baltica]
MSSTNSSPPNRQRILDLADKQIDCTANEAEMAELESILIQNSDAQRTYLRYMLVHGQLASTNPAIPTDSPVLQPDQMSANNVRPNVSASRSFTWRKIAVTAMAASIIAVIAFYSRHESKPKTADIPASSPQWQTRQVAYRYDQRKPPIESIGTIGTDRNATGPHTLNMADETIEFQSPNGTNLQVLQNSIFGINSANGGVLYMGSVLAKSADESSPISVATSNIRVLGTGYKVRVLDKKNIAVRADQDPVAVEARIRSPLYYLNFDSPDKSDRSTAVVYGSAATPTRGIVGEGAVNFDNSDNAIITFDEGMGDAVGTGEMACSTGMSIELMFISRWSGDAFDYDELMRKEDGDYRFLLSFQNDNNVGKYAVPTVAAGPCLSFGLHLAGFGYSELDVPLDGRNNRPHLSTITDGNAHHVAATYDSFSGRKCLYIDGRLCFETQFPVGTLILSGGSEPASIGNSKWQASEGFDGILDEVAFYDFALTPAEIRSHYRHASRGKPYFDSDVQPSTSRRWKPIANVASGTAEIFNDPSGKAINEDELAE